MKIEGKIKSKLVCVVLAALILIPMLVPLGMAYFEYLAKHDVLINGDGSINQNAFGVLNGEEYRASEYGYGTTPENPFTIDNIDHLYNLIKLNNSGRMINAKMNGEVYENPQYYFVLNFTGQDLPQVLNLNGITIPSVGNNDYPFIDQFSGLLYAYCYNEDSYVYLSGLIDTVNVEVNSSTGEVTIDGVVTEVLNSDVQSGKYIKIPERYIDFMDEDDGITDGNNIYVPVSSLKPIHNVIANATVSVPDDQIDVGFFNTIARDTVMTASGSVEVEACVKDVIFYNLTINCVEQAESSGSVWTALSAVWDSLFGNHNFEDTNTYDPVSNVYYERHIGLFAGHIDGAAANITVAGDCRIQIDSTNVNYYSAYTTVGFIHEDAVIGNIPFSEMLTSGENVSDITGCMFADSIYAVAESEIGGLTQYELTGIPASGLWKGTQQASDGNLYFTYGSFHFILSDESDMVGKIWSGESEIKLLNEEGYTAKRSVLYCNDEYRYTDSPQTGGSLIPGAASANETQYQGMHTLIASGSTLDKGKYIITAKIPVDGGYEYYALKIIAEIVDENQLIYSFDNSVKCQVTDYINDETGNLSIYSSALWQTAADSPTPTFRNTRFDTQYFTVSVADGDVTKGLTAVSADAESFKCNVLENSLTYTVTENTENGIVSTDYYLNYNTDNGFYFSKSKNTIIEIYRLSNGFSIELVDDAEKITENEDYLIVGKSGSTYYLLGEEILEEAGSTVVTATGTFGADYVFSEMPSLWSLQEYQNFRQYIWYAGTASSSGSTASVIFNEKVGGVYYLDISEGQLDMTSGTPSSPWIYTQGASGGTLANGVYYLKFAYASATETNFSVVPTVSTIYIYKIIPQDDDPKYTTYRGANLVTSESSSVESGQYVIASNIGTQQSPSYVALTLDVNGNILSTDVTSYITGSAEMDPPTEIYDPYGNYKWEVDTTSTTPVLRNKGTSTFLSASGTNLSAYGSAVSWRYNAGMKHLYYTETNGGVTVYRYLCYDTSSGGFCLTEGMLSGGTYIYDIGMFKVIYTYTYTSVTEVSSLTAGKSYMIATQPLGGISTTTSYVVGSESTLMNSDPKLIPLTPSNTSYTGTTMTTTEDLSYYKWTYSYDPNYWNIFTNYQNNGTNGTTAAYLSVSSAGGTRTFAITNLLNNAQNNQTYYNSNNPVTHFEYSDRTSGGSILKFRGTGYYYYLYTPPVPGFVKIYNGGSTSSLTAYYIYLYDVTNYTTDVGFELVSTKGDNLEANYHYMITVRTGEEENPQTQYYALSESVGDDGYLRFTGINVTSQCKAINNSYVESEGIIKYHSTDADIMVPLDSDWYQTNSTKELFFYHSEYSTEALKQYLDVSSSDPTQFALTGITTGSSQTSVNWYYDEVNHYFKYYIGETVYYLTYDRSGDVFSLTTDISQAVKAFIYRFKPTYIVSQVTSTAEESLKNGYYIVTAKDSSSDIALGMDNTSMTASDITDYLSNINASTGNIEMTETQYNDLLQFIWYQRYYDYYSDQYNSAGTSAISLLFSQYATGGFVANSSDIGFSPASYPMEWLTASASGGTWTFKNNEVNGSITSGSRGILYGGIKYYLQIGDGNITTGSYLNSLTSGTEFSASGSYVYLCDTSGNAVTSMTQLSAGSSYLLRATSNGRTLMVKNTNGTISLVDYNLSSTTGCLWTATLAPGGFTLKNGSHYAAANSSSAVTASTTSAGIWYFGSGGILEYTTVNIPYRSSNTNASLSTNAGQYWARVYKYSDSGSTTTLTPATSINTTDNYVIVMYNGSSYYAMYLHSNNSIRPYSISPTVLGSNLIISSLATAYQFGAAVNGRGMYRFVSRARTRYLNYDEPNLTSVTEVSSYIWSVDSNGYFYYVTHATAYNPCVLYSSYYTANST
ncbi:MAG: hypothetical protein PHW77_05060, partial [Eubacteriales bacterium]|nr:hypothetical protein [Eubacteriales bacterium]